MLLRDDIAVMHRQAGDSHVGHSHEYAFRDPAVQVLQPAAGSGIDIPSDLIMRRPYPLQQAANIFIG